VRAADAPRTGLDDRIGVIAFAVAMVVVEWPQCRFTELATWSATGYTQVDNLPLLCRAGRGLGRAGVVGRDADRAPGRLSTDRSGEPARLGCGTGRS
jgi:hypothetical protein